MRQIDHDASDGIPLVSDDKHYGGRDAIYGFRNNHFTRSATRLNTNFKVPRLLR